MQVEQVREPAFKEHVAGWHLSGGDEAEFVFLFISRGVHVVWGRRRGGGEVGAISLSSTNTPCFTFSRLPARGHGHFFPVSQQWTLLSGVLMSTRRVM